MHALLGNVLRECQEGLPVVDRATELGLVVGVGSALPHDQSTHGRNLVTDRFELGQLGAVLHSNHLRVTVVHNVLDCFGTIGRVDTSSLATTSNSSKVGPEPFGTVETDNVHTVKRLDTKMKKSTTGKNGVIVMLLPGPNIPTLTIISLSAQSRLITVAGDSLFEEFENSRTFNRSNPLGTLGKIEFSIRFTGKVLTRRTVRTVVSGRLAMCLFLGNAFREQQNLGQEKCHKGKEGVEEHVEREKNVGTQQEGHKQRGRHNQITHREGRAKKKDEKKKKKERTKRKDERDENKHQTQRSW
mmetsp:Transcript_10923/g.33478  ORF Transcript_10923/g.33478 Transcript_10923/m.33478 type:complete len:300 (-) Transcript_10923:64-963(-)